MIGMSRVVRHDYADSLAERMTDESRALAERWLDRLSEVLPVDADVIFPTAELLDHIPLLIEQIAAYLCAPADMEIAANTSVIEKAQELGYLRHEQQASVHQILREYDILADLLEQFVFDETSKLANAQSLGLDCLGISQRLGHAVRTLMQTTVDTFVSQYTATIAEQTTRLDSFNRMLMHELRTPLGTLLFAAELLNRSEASGDRASCVRLAGLIQRNLEHLSGSIRGLERLVFAERLVDAPNRQQVHIGAMAAEVARQLGDMAHARRVEIRITEPLPTLVVDAGQLELVLMNLLTNSIKYSDPAKPIRYVEVTSSDERQTDGHTFCVRDNGVGIPPALLGSVFKRYFRAYRERDDQLGIEGSGLGLSIVEESVRALGGRIHVESVEGSHD